MPVTGMSSSTIMMIIVIIGHHDHAHNDDGGDARENERNLKGAGVFSRNPRHDLGALSISGDHQGGNHRVITGQYSATRMPGLSACVPARGAQAGPAQAGSLVAS